MLLIESVLTAYTTQQGKARSGAPAAVHQLWAIVARLPQDGGPATGRCHGLSAVRTHKLTHDAPYRPCSDFPRSLTRAAGDDDWGGGDADDAGGD